MPASISVMFSGFLGWFKTGGSSRQKMNMNSRTMSTSQLKECSESLRNSSDAKGGVLFLNTCRAVAEGRLLREQGDSTVIDDQEYRAPSNLGVNNVSVNNDLGCLEEQIEIPRQNVAIDNETILSIKTAIKQFEQKFTSQQIAMKDLADIITNLRSEMREKGFTS